MAAPGPSTDPAADTCDPVSVHCGTVPSVAFDREGRLWVAFEHGGIVWVSGFADAGTLFGAATAVNSVPEEIETNGENRPKIAFSGDAILVSWTRKLQGAFAGEIRFARSLDGGASFELARTINDDGLEIGHRFDSLEVDALGHVYIAWIDKRDLEAAQERGEEYLGAALYYTVSTDQGATFAPNRRVAHHVCECCRIAMTPSTGGGVGLFWRHVFEGNIRDHAFAVLGADGVTVPLRRATWEGWQLDGCPHHGGSVAAATGGGYHLAWFTAAGDEPAVWYGRFDPKRGDLAHAQTVASSAVAHPFVLESDGVVRLVWKERADDTTGVFLSESSNGGRDWRPKRRVASTVASSDHPFLIRSAEQTYLVWHTAEHGLLIQPLASGTE